MSEQSRAGRKSPRAAIWVACLGAGIVTSGIQGVAPAIPAIQSEFSLTAAEVALITSVYLFPSMFSALAAGALADRVGIRPVFAGALVLFGAGALVLLMEHSLWVLFTVRFVQGAAFGAVVSLSVSIIGGIVASGPQAARAQGQRIITMAAAEALLPLAAGFLVAIAWFAPFGLQLLALPVAALCWAALPSVRPSRKDGTKAGLRSVASSRAFAGVQTLGALRFVFKFAVLTYFPLLAVNEVGLSEAAVGVALGAAAFVTAVAAWLTERLANRWSSSQLIAGCLALIAVSMAAMGASDAVLLVLAALLVFGLQDGVFGVAHNVLVTEMAPPDARSTYVGVTGTVRNVGKFVAPMIFGATTLVVTVSQGFLVFAGLGVTSLAAARSVVRAQRTASADGELAPAPGPPHTRPDAVSRPEGPAS